MADRPDDHLVPDSDGESAASMWYVAVSGQVFGPASAVTLREWAAEGRLTAGAQVRPLDGGAWALPTAFPELQDLSVLSPPPVAPPVPAGTAAYRAPRPGVCACPDCGGSVRNVAPAYGWPWGLWQRALKPKFACESCRAPIAFSRLTKAAQAQVTRRMRIAFAGWIIVVVFVILGIASPFLVALAYR